MTERLHRYATGGLLVVLAIALGAMLRPSGAFATGLSISASTTSGATTTYIPFNVSGQASGTTLYFVVHGTGCIVNNRAVRTTTAGVCTVEAAERFASGISTYSSPVNFTFSHAPLATKVRTLVAGNHAVTVTWLAASTRRGGAVTRYSVASTPSVTPPSSCSNTTALSCSFTGLNVGTSYTFKVTATNVSGSTTSVASVASTPYGLINNIKVYPRGKFVGDNFANGDFSGFNLTKANFIHCNFSNANLTSANFSQANLAHANLTGATVSHTNFAGVTWLQSPTGGLVGTPSALPTGYSLTVGYIVGPHAYLSHANLTGANLTGVNLSSAIMSATQSGGITGTPAALPTSWVLAKGYLFGPNAIVTGADVSGVNLSTSRLTGVVSGTISGTPSALPLNFVLRGGYLVGPGANLTNVNFSGVDLTNADLYKANLTGADIATATSLSGVSSGAVVGSPTIPSSWRNVNGALVGAGANLTGLNLSGVDFSSLNLTNTDFTGAIVHGASFRGATLTNAVFDAADITDADFTSTDLSTVSSIGLVGTTSLLPTHWLIIDSSFAPPFTLSFDNGGGSGTSPAISYAQGDTVTLPSTSGSLTAPTYQTFNGWICDGTSYNAGDTFSITNDITCVAQWAPIPVTLSYSAGTGSGTIDSVSYNEGDSVTLPSDQGALISPNYQAFSGWVCGTTSYRAGDTFTILSDLTCTAQWSAIPATLSFDAGTGTGTIASQSYNQGDTATLPSDQSSLSAPPYTAFNGWVCGFDSYSAGSSFTITGDTTCTAQWASIPATVTFSAGDGTGSIPAVSSSQGSSIPLPDASTLTAPANETFNGWVCATVSYNAGDTLFITGDTTCTAQWSAIPATLTFDSGGASGSLDPITVNQGTSLNMPDAFTLVAPDGTTFQGWSVYPTGGDPSSAQPYNVGDSLTMDSNYTAVATWG